MFETLNEFAKSNGIPLELFWALFGAAVMILLVSLKRSLGISTCINVSAYPRDLANTKNSAKFMSVNTVASTKGVVSANIGGKPVSFDLPAEVSEQLLTLIRQGKKIAAIKLIRKATGIDLVDAKHMAEALENTAGPK